MLASSYHRKRKLGGPIGGLARKPIREYLQEVDQLCFCSKIDSRPIQVLTSDLRVLVGLQSCGRLVGAILHHRRRSLKHNNKKQRLLQRERKPLDQ